MPDFQINEPLVSLIAVIKNGMPHIKEAIKSAKNQTYQNIELIIQDGGSIDGTLEFINSLQGTNIHIKSESDKNIGDGWNRALKRCKGGIIGSIDADNILKKEGVERVVKLFEVYPNSAAIYGVSRIIDNMGENKQKIPTHPKAQPFNLIRLMRCDLVPPFASSFFNRKICKQKLYLDEKMGTCWDYDLWLRISNYQIISTNQTLSYTRRHKNSSTCRPENYEKFCKNKMYALKKYISQTKNNLTINELYKFSLAGIYSWAAESIYGLEGKSKNFYKYSKLALNLDPYSEKIKLLKQF